MIKKNGDKWHLYSDDGKKLLGTFDDIANAVSQYEAITASLSEHPQILTGVEVFRAGEHNGDPFTNSDLDAMVSAFQELDFSPAIKIGHKQNGSEAYGYIENLRRDGDVLMADFTHLDDETKKKIKARRYSRVSAEIYFNFKRDGKTYPFVLGAVALLGHEIPGVSKLKPLYVELATTESAKCYTLDFQTLEDKRGTAVPLKVEGGIMSETVEQLQAKLAKYEVDLAKVSGYEAELKELKTFAQDNAVLRERINQLQDESTKRVAEGKANAVALPALREHFVTLYNVALTAKEKVKHYSVADKKAVDVDLSAVLDEMVAYVNTKVSPLFKTFSLDDKKTVQDADNAVEAGKQLDALATAYATEKKVDYATAFAAVSRENPQLVKVYSS